MPSTPARSLSPWWALLLLPASLGFGWAVGHLPTPAPREPSAVARQDEVAVRALPESAPHKPAGIVSTPSLVEVTEHRAPDPAPAEIEQSSRETRRDEYSQWTTLESALAESERNGKPVLIDFNADWCGPCQRMKREVFDHGLHAQVVQTAVIPVSIVDRVRENGSNPPEIENLQRRFQVDAFPTLVVFSPGSGRVMKTKSFGSAEATLAWITQAAKAVR